MDAALNQLCQLIKQTIENFTQNNQAFAFNLLIGKKQQGKSSLFEADKNNIIHPITENGINFIHNKQGILIEFNEDWLNSQDKLLGTLIKKINSCNPISGITGIIYCVDISALLMSYPEDLSEIWRQNLKLLNRFGTSLKNRTDLNIFFTKMDLVAGFVEYFLNDSETDFARPLGFSVNHCLDKKTFYSHLDKQFDLFVDILAQKVIHRLHPVRSVEKRTLIREFPLQIAILKKPIQFMLASLDSKIFNLKTVCFTSTKQGSSMRINKIDRKVNENCAIVTMEKNIILANNKRNYFGGGAIRASQEFTKTHILPPSIKQKILFYSGIGCFSLLLLINTLNHWHVMRKLDSSQQALATFNVLHQQHTQPLTALYHLLQAENIMANLSARILRHLSLLSVKFNISAKLEQQIDQQFLPFIFRDLENIMADPNVAPLQRYNALKIYLMFNDPIHRNNNSIITWYQNNWQKTTTTSLLTSNLSILNAVLLKYTNIALPINSQLVRDTRNYLNAIPADYFYYQLIKNNIDPTNVKITLSNWHLANDTIPNIYLNNNFNKTLAVIHDKSFIIKTENWILQRQDVANIESILQLAYCREYVKWWQNFLTKSFIDPIDSYERAQLISEKFVKDNSLNKFLALIKHNLAPNDNKIFNKNIASNFSSLFLINQEQFNNLNRNIYDLSKFLKTLNLVSQNKKTIYDLTANRFTNDFATDPLSQLYLQINQLPTPVNIWIKQFADQIWYLFIKDSKEYLDILWEKNVIFNYKMSIADHYPLNSKITSPDLSLDAFQHFFAPQGVILNFLNQYLRPFINTSNANWQSKEKNGYVMPFKTEVLQSLIRANVISSMFFQPGFENMRIEFSLQKLDIDPIINSIQIRIGDEQLVDNQNSDSFVQFTWPATNAYVMIKSIQGRTFNMAETGDWALFKLLQKMNIYLDENDSSLLQILFEINGNQAHYVLKTNNKINPFSPGILNNFNLSDSLF